MIEQLTAPYHLYHEHCIHPGRIDCSWCRNIFKVTIGELVEQQYYAKYVAEIGGTAIEYFYEIKAASERSQLPYQTI